jgi:hypothetical protein
MRTIIRKTKKTVKKMEVEHFEYLVISVLMASYFMAIFPLR